MDKAKSHMDTLKITHGCTKSHNLENLTAKNRPFSHAEASESGGGGAWPPHCFQKHVSPPPPPNPHTHVWGQLAQVTKTVYTEMHTSIREAIQHHRNSYLHTRSHTTPPPLVASPVLHNCQAIHCVTPKSTYNFIYE